MNLEYGLFSVRLHDYNQTLKVLFLIVMVENFATLKVKDIKNSNEKINELKITRMWLAIQRIKKNCPRFFYKVFLFIFIKQ